MQKPQLAQRDQVLAIPTLVRNLPTPIRKIIGDLSNTEKVLLGAGLRTHFTQRDRMTFSPKSPGRANPPPGPANYVLRLFVTGNSARARRSVMNLQNFCQQFLPGRYQLEIVDIYQQPSLAREEQIVAAPTLIRRQPLPLRRLVGDFSDQERVASGLEVSLQGSEAQRSEIKQI